MTKTPEEYFKEQEFNAKPVAAESVPDASGNFTAAERAFMEKYLGMNEKAVLGKLGIEASENDSAAGAARSQNLVPESAPEIEREPDLIEQLKNDEELQLVSFFVGVQEFTVPIIAVQEVIKFMPPTRLPAAPHFVAGIINLRGRVTPLVHLRDLLGNPRGQESGDQFIVVCRRHGLQLGLIIDRVHTMYRTAQSSVDWAIESHLGVNVEFISGLMKSGDKLIGIISVDRIVDSVLQL